MRSGTAQPDSMKKIWKQPFTLEQLNALSRQTMVAHLGIELVEAGDDYLKATMPVDHRTVQPMRLLHGGASVALAETLGSVAGVLCLDDLERHTVVGVDISATHLRPGREGQIVTGIARPLKLGRRVQVWQIDIYDERGKQLCASRITLAVVERRAEAPPGRS